MFFFPIVFFSLKKIFHWVFSKRTAQFCHGNYLFHTVSCKENTSSDVSHSIDHRFNFQVLNKSLWTKQLIAIYFYNFYVFWKNVCPCFVIYLAIVFLKLHFRNSNLTSKTVLTVYFNCYIYMKGKSLNQSLLLAETTRNVLRVYFLNLSEFEVNINQNAKSCISRNSSQNIIANLSITIWP